MRAYNEARDLLNISHTICARRSDGTHDKVAKCPWRTFTGDGMTEMLGTKGPQELMG